MRDRSGSFELWLHSIVTISFGQTFYGKGLLLSRVSSEVLAWSQQIAMLASHRATLQCAKAFATTDFRRDMAAFTLPTLIIHGTADETVPIDASARVAAKLVRGARLIEYDDEPHGLNITAKAKLTADLLAFAGA